MQAIPRKVPAALIAYYIHAGALLPPVLKESEDHVQGSTIHTSPFQHYDSNGKLDLLQLDLHVLLLTSWVLESSCSRSKMFHIKEAHLISKQFVCSRRTQLNMIPEKMDRFMSWC